MTDCFALLGETRRPWLEPELLQAKFRAMSAREHPDRVHSAGELELQAATRRYTELNAAYRRLRDPKERLHHLLELETGAKPTQVQTVPNDLMDLFTEVNRLLKGTDALLKLKAQTRSPLLQVALFEQGQQWTEQLLGLQTALRPRQEHQLAELKALDTEWPTAGEPNLSARNQKLQRLEELYRYLSFSDRWQQQIQERLASLAF